MNITENNPDYWMVAYERVRAKEEENLRFIPFQYPQLRLEEIPPSFILEA